MGEVLVAGLVGVHADVRGARIKRVELRQPVSQPRLVADHSAVLRHRVADRALEGADVLRAVGGQLAHDLGAGGLHGLG